MLSPIKLSQNFSQSEFNCKCGGKHNSPMDLNFIMMLQKLRNFYGKPIKITSGFRCEEWNAKIGGVDGSLHTLGLAADIKCTNSIDRAEIVKYALEVGFKTIIVAKNYIHLDNGHYKKQRIIVK
jgi:uncharacterized protein YcbK (DUF882 family)